jgi:hypothetical protein
MRQDLRSAFGSIGESAFKDFGDTGVKRAPWLAQQRAIGRVLHQGMLEQVACLRQHALSEQQSSLNETVERPSSASDFRATNASSGSAIGR